MLRQRSVVWFLLLLHSVLTAVLLLAALVWLIVLQMDKETLLAWGWRIPFLSSIVIAAVALFIRRNMRETPVFERQKKVLEEQRRLALEQGRKHVAEVDTRSFWKRTKAFWIMVGLRIGENGPSYLAQGFIIGYVAKVLMIDKSVPTMAVFIASVLGFLIIPLAGYLSDRFGRRITYRWFCLLLVLYAFPAFMLLDTREPGVGHWYYYRGHGVGLIRNLRRTGCVGR
ncbi:Proline porter II [Budvicia aquatica]|uniref:Proline porter II n=1 Tax=Budvicia aquatica TaxID=82979 RepID=A0A484ZVS7_9GAMM|nr:Proline porter II [Budvicia aquatica]